MNSLFDRAYWALFMPKVVTALREGYTLASLRADILAGLTVAIVALPLSMALAIASGTTPDRGLVTAIVAGFMISAFGGSRFQIGGPTGAFVVIVFQIIQDHGFDGLLLATLMAGVILMILGFARLGTFIKYIPYPVVTGFTAGIALIIFSSQMKDFLGLDLANADPGVIDTWHAIITRISTIHPATAVVGIGTLGLILLIRRIQPSYPIFLIGVTAASVIVWGFDLPVETIGTRFGAIPSSLPAPHMPDISLQKVIALLPSALTIALLAGIESLLSAVVADGMTGRRHRSNCELVGQGVANIASALMGGICATGAIARTATNIRSGAISPISGIVHALALLAFMLIAAPLAGYLPLPALAAVLVIVAWNMSEHERFRHLMRAPAGDRMVLLVTFFLTVLVDLTAAIQVGVVMAAVLFMHRMAHAVEAESGVKLIAEDEADPVHGSTYAPLGQGGDVAVYKINGPFFFGVAAKLGDVLDQIGHRPKTFVVDLANVPVVDATAVHALGGVVDKCRRQGIAVRLVGVKKQPRSIFASMGLIEGDGVTIELAPSPEP